MIGDSTFVNHVLFNLVHRTVNGGRPTAAMFSIINNYLKPGQPHPKVRRFRMPAETPSERSKTW